MDGTIFRGFSVRLAQFASVGHFVLDLVPHAAQVTAALGMDGIPQVLLLVAAVHDVQAVALKCPLQDRPLIGLGELAFLDRRELISQLSGDLLERLWVEDADRLAERAEGCSADAEVPLKLDGTVAARLAGSDLGSLRCANSMPTAVIIQGANLMPNSSGTHLVSSPSESGR